MLELKDFCFTIEKDGEPLNLVDRVNITVPSGHFMAIVGPSGCGKTTLLNTIAGLNEMSEGSIHWNGRDLELDGDFDPAELGYVPQFSIAYDELTVDESIEAVTKLRVKTRDLDDLDQRIDRVQEETGLAPIADRKVKVLSGGQKRRLGLAMELVTDPKLLLCDEVQCGLGRTGKWFGFQHYDMEPDAFSLAKALGNGFPIGAIVTGKKLADTFQPGHHASTFGGTPLACAAALAVIEVIEEEGLLENTVKMGEMIAAGLQEMADQYDWAESVRGKGLMVGLVLDRPAKELEKLLMEKGLITLATAERIIRLLPPLNISEQDVTQALAIIKEGCAEFNEKIER